MTMKTTHGLILPRQGGQKYRVLSYLIEHKTLEPLVAWRELGIYRLAARVNELRADGWPIHSDFLDVTTQFGDTVQVGMYWLDEAWLKENRKNLKAVMRGRDAKITKVRCAIQKAKER